MGYIIVVAGKGGTGKTTIAALLVRLIREKKLGSCLAVDADPNSSLGEALGVQITASIGNVLENGMKPFIVSMMGPIEKPPEATLMQKVSWFFRMSSKHEEPPALLIDGDDLGEVETESSCHEKVLPILKSWLEDPSQFLQLQQEEVRVVVDSIKKHFLPKPPLTPRE